MTILAVAWDIDGTLIDSEPLHHRSLLAGTRQFGIDLSDIPEDEFCGVHMHDVWTRIHPRLPAQVEQGQWLAAIYSRHAGMIALGYPAQAVAFADLDRTVADDGDLVAMPHWDPQRHAMKVRQNQWLRA